MSYRLQLGSKHGARSAVCTWVHMGEFQTVETAIADAVKTFGSEGIHLQRLRVVDETGRVYWTSGGP